jgi:hypothetical protein
MKIQLAPIAALLSALFFSNSAQAASEQDLQNSFDPYVKGFPEFPGVKPGLVIDKTNLELYNAIFDPGLHYVIENDWHQIKVGPTHNFS